MTFLLLIAVVMTGPARADSVNIYVASSVSEAMDAILANYDPGPGNEVAAIYAGTSTLARQIEAGAPADIILFANEDWATYLSERNLLASLTRTPLLTNELVLVTPRLSPIEFDLEGDVALVDALGNSRLAMGDPGGVPAGIYGREALQAAGEWESLQGSLVFGESVRTVMNWVARAEVAAAIVYSSDALSTSSILVEETFPAESHSPIRYPLAMTQDSAERPEVIAIYEYLRGPRAAAIFTTYGFGTSLDE